MDMLDQARLGCPIRTVMITDGNFENYESGHYCVPKRDLITGLQVILQRGGLKIAEGMGELKELLAAMQVKIDLKGNEQYGSWREGEHDDLVLAVALACWRGSVIRAWCWGRGENVSQDGSAIPKTPTRPTL
jgi:hypothetical protein